MSDAPTVPMKDGWIEWAGGENPVGSADVAYRVSDDLEDVRYGFADQLDWRRIPAHPKAPITAYRVVSVPLEEGGSLRASPSVPTEGREAAVVGLLDEISALCTSFNDQIHDADDTLGKINQLAYAAIAALRPETVRTGK